MTTTPDALLPSSPTSGRRLAALLMGGALLGKVLGFAREILMAKVLGASLVADSFRGGMTAVLLPLLMLQNEGVPAILIPMYRNWLPSGQAPKRFAALSVALFFVSVGIFVLLQAMAPFWVSLVVGGFSADGQALTLQFVRIMALAMPASVLLNCLAAAEIALGRSRITSLRSAVVNIAVIAGVVTLALTGRTTAIAWCFAGAFNLLGGWALWTLLRDGVLDPEGLTYPAVGAACLDFFRRLRPLVVQPLAEQGQVWIERLIASGLAVGTVATLDYARTLTDSAILLVSQPVGLAVLAAGPSNDPRQQMEALARPVLTIALPISVFLVVFAPEVVELVFRRGAFGDHAVLLTSQALSGIAAGLWAATLGWILLRMLNSAGRNSRAAAILACAYGANAVLSFVVVPWLGGLGLGLGEAARGVVLLVGTALSLGCLLPLGRVLLLAAPVTGLLLAVEVAVHFEVSGLLPRLLVGGLACAGAILLSAALLMPGSHRTIWQFFMTRFGARLGLRRP